MTARKSCLLIILIGLLLYAPSAFFGLSYLDDNILIVENHAFLSSLSNIVQAFGQDVFHVLREYAAAYRPLLTVSFIVDTRLDAIFGLGYHFSNIVFHLIASCLVFLLFVKLKYGRQLALFFALVFTVHPALVQAVAWIPGRNDSLLGIFILSSFICFLEFIERKKWPHLAWHLIFFILALFTKEAAAVFPFVCVGYLFFVAKDKSFSFSQKRLIAGWCFALALWLAFRGYALSYNPVALSAAGISGDLARGAGAILGYLGKAVLPFNLSIIPVIEDTNMIYGVVALAAIASGLVFSKAKRYGYILFGGVWFLAFLAPTFIRPVAGTSAIFLESRLYLPMLGVFFVLAEIDIVKNIVLTKRHVFFCVAIISALFFMSAAHAVNFKDALTFWKCAAKRSPHSSMAQYNLGWIYDRQGDLDRAEGQYLRALALDPRQRYAHNSLGTIYERKGLFARAEAEYIKEIKNTPYNAAAYRNLVNLQRHKSLDTSAH
jgi:hypothetical protein